MKTLFAVLALSVFLAHAGSDAVKPPAPPPDFDAPQPPPKSANSSKARSKRQAPVEEAPPLKAEAKKLEKKELAPPTVATLRVKLLKINPSRTGMQSKLDWEVQNWTNFNIQTGSITCSFYDSEEKYLAKTEIYLTGGIEKGTSKIFDSLLVLDTDAKVDKIKIQGNGFVGEGFNMVKAKVEYVE